MFRYSTAQVEFIKANVDGRYVQELTEMFNSHFGVQLKLSQMRAFIKNHSLKNGMDARFKPGAVPANKGSKGLHNVGGNKTSFKKGQRPLNYMPVGTERINTDGYAEIKIADPNKWKGKHILVWEQHHGRSVPKGHVVIFGDRNRRNFDPSNLILVSRSQLAIMNKNNLIQENAELTQTGVILADIYHKIGQRKKRQL